MVPFEIRMIDALLQKKPFFLVNVDLEIDYVTDFLLT